MDAICPVHQVPFKFVEPGVSRKTGKPYSGFWSCPTFGCQQKPNQPMASTPTSQYQAPKLSPEKGMTKEDWEAKEKRTNRNILLQVAFKAAVELVAAGKLDIKVVEFQTLDYHTWLLSQTEGQPARFAPSPTPAPSDSYEDIPMNSRMDDPEAQ